MKRRQQRVPPEPSQNARARQRTLRGPDVDPVNKLLLGVTPTDSLDTLRGPCELGGTPTGGRQQVIDAYLARQPEVRAELARDIATTWEQVRGNRLEFLSALAERRAQVLSSALLSDLPGQSVESADRFLAELQRYLAEAELRGGA